MKLYHCWLVVTGRLPYTYCPERFNFEMALDQLNAAVANLQNAANAIIAKLAADDASLAQVQAALAQAQSDLASGDATQAAAVQAVADSLNAAAAPPAPPAP
jgi:predicted trehalose synthase